MKNIHNAKTRKPWEISVSNKATLVLLTVAKMAVI